MRDATFTAPDLTTFTRVDGLDLRVIGRRVTLERAVLACRVIAEDRWCRRCGCQGRVRGSVRRRLADEPFGWRPNELEREWVERTPAVMFALREPASSGQMDDLAISVGLGVGIPEEARALW